MSHLASSQIPGAMENGRWSSKPCLITKGKYTSNMFKRLACQRTKRYPRCYLINNHNLSGKNGQETSGNHAKWVLFMNIMKESPATSHRSSRRCAHLFPMFFIDLMRRFDGSSTLTRAMGVTSISFRWLTYWQSNGNPISLRFSTEWVQNTHGGTYGRSCKRNQTTTLTAAGIPNQQSL